MCFLLGTNWVFISQQTTFFVVTAVKTSNLTNYKPRCYDTPELGRDSVKGLKLSCRYAASSVWKPEINDRGEPTR
jgi:hypothetical protein